MTKTLVLPGFSHKNAEWVENLKTELTDINLQTITWPHWETGITEDGWKEKEAKVIYKIADAEKINILAKSIGTLVAMEALLMDTKIEKIILCGIPLNDLEDHDLVKYDALKKIDPTNIICFQNENDNHGSFQEAKLFFKKINPKILVNSKPRDDHEYPYYDEFREFLVTS